MSLLVVIYFIAWVLFSTRQRISQSLKSLMAFKSALKTSNKFMRCFPLPPFSCSNRDVFSSSSMFVSCCSTEREDGKRSMSIRPFLFLLLLVCCGNFVCFSVETKISSSWDRESITRSPKNRWPLHKLRWNSINPHTNATDGVLCSWHPSLRTLVSVHCKS